MCNCTEFIDIRGRCDIKDKSFKTCPARVYTTLFHLENDYELYKKTELCCYKEKKKVFCIAARNYLSKKDANKIEGLMNDDEEYE